MTTSFPSNRNLRTGFVGTFHCSQRSCSPMVQDILKPTWYPLRLFTLKTKAERSTHRMERVWTKRYLGWTMIYLLYVLCQTSQDRSRFLRQCIVQGDILLQVITPNDNPPLDEFVRHAKNSGYEEGEILHHASFGQCRGVRFSQLQNAPFSKFWRLWILNESEEPKSVGK